LPEKVKGLNKQLTDKDNELKTRNDTIITLTNEKGQLITGLNQANQDKQNLNNQIIHLVDDKVDLVAEVKDRDAIISKKNETISELNTALRNQSQNKKSLLYYLNTRPSFNSLSREIRAKEKELKIDLLHITDDKDDF